MKKLKVKFLFFTFYFLFFTLILGAADFMDYTTVINQKMQTEKRIEEHLQGIVSKIVGEGRSTVIVSIQVADLTKSRVKTEQWMERAEDERAAALPVQEEVLPGIPVRPRVEEREVERPSPEKEGGKRIEDILTLPSEFIRSIRVNLILDKAIPDDTVATVESVINDVIDMNPARGDRVTIQRVDFAGRRINFIGFLFNPYFYVILLILVTLTVAALFLFGPLRKFLFAALQTMKDLKGIKSETEYTGSGAGGGGGGAFGGVGAGMGAGEIEIEEELEKRKKEAEEKEKVKEFEKMSYKPLKFLEEKDLKKLAYLLNYEKPEVAAILFGYLDSEKVVKIMASLSPEKRPGIMKNMIKIQRTSCEIMQKIDDFLSQKIDYVIGGADKLVSILEVMNEEERDNLIKSLSEDDEEFAEKIKSRIFSFDNIIKLDDEAMQVVIQSLDTKDIGVALKNAPDEIKNKFVSNMSEGAAALLKEEIEFGKKVTEAEIKGKQSQVVAKIKQLESEGTIKGVTGAGGDELWKEELGEEEKTGVLEEIIKAAKSAISKKEAIEKDADVGSQDEVAFNFYEQGLNAYKVENYEEAIKQFSQSIEYNPNVWQTYQYLGSCYTAIGDDENAKTAYRKSLELNPENAELKEFLAGA